MFRFAKNKNNIRKVSEKCRKYFSGNMENVVEDIEEESLFYEENTDAEQLEELFMLMNILLKQQDLL